jgi:hypothetical protein
MSRIRKAMGALLVVMLVTGTCVSVGADQKQEKKDHKKIPEFSAKGEIDAKKNWDTNYAYVSNGLQDVKARGVFWLRGKNADCLYLDNDDTTKPVYKQLTYLGVTGVNPSYYAWQESGGSRTWYFEVTPDQTEQMYAIYRQDGMGDKLAFDWSFQVPLP